MNRSFVELAWMALGAALVACLLAAPALAPQPSGQGDPAEVSSGPSASAASGGAYVEMFTRLCATHLDRESPKP